MILLEKEVEDILKQLTNMSSDKSLEVQQCKVIPDEDDDSALAYCVFIYHHLSMGSHESEPEHWTDVDVIPLVELAGFIDSQSALDHDIAEDLRAYYYAHVEFDKWIKSKDGLNTISILYKDLTFNDAYNFMKCLFYSYQQLYRCEQNIKQLEQDFKDGLDELEISIYGKALNDKFHERDNLKWEIETLLFK